MISCKKNPPNEFENTAHYRSIATLTLLAATLLLIPSLVVDSQRLSVRVMLEHFMSGVEIEG